MRGSRKERDRNVNRMGRDGQNHEMTKTELLRKRLDSLFIKSYWNDPRKCKTQQPGGKSIKRMNYRDSLTRIFIVCYM